jgi:hypothetical protein
MTVVPTVETEDPVGLNVCVSAFEIRQFAAKGLTGADIAAAGITPQRLNLFC